MQYLSLTELYEFAASHEYSKNGVDNLLLALDSMFTEFVNNFYDTKIVCKLSEPHGIENRGTLVSASAQYFPQCLYVESISSSIAGRDDLYRYVISYIMSMKNSYGEIAHYYISFELFVLDGHIVVPFNEESGQPQSVPYAEVMMSVRTNDYNIEADEMAFSSSPHELMDITLYAQGNLASATPVDITVDIVDEGTS